ncbi:mitochondrial carrier protein [Magnaporthiopsis poae ATCC 64411]|uniref:Mitochondrial carrier protein n=1 Tax=Magnaporthiopsis poae (strain ATCC 64411 / 73-15) TaxID=644358 RepID=A0A0C4DWR4_MAGP6|nr:mitochondrial carrier protein [Magnaporthiopsis poae ATCC 64411]
MTRTDANGEGKGPPRPGTTSAFPGGAGVLPVVPPPGSDLYDKTQRKNAATAASAAGVRAFTAQAVAFYFRAPVKAFFRTRVDYLAFARSIHLERHQQQQQQQHGPQAGLGGRLRQIWFWLRGTTPGVLASAIRQEGWSVVPDHVLPPLMANVAVGAVLYSSYLHILAHLHEESGRGAKRVYPPPGPQDTFTAGLLAGSIQSFVAAPLDAIQARYDHRELMAAGAAAAKDGGGSGKPPSMWSFSAAKLREIGLRGVFAGWGMSLAKDSVGSAVFFSTFEYVKAQGYYGFVRWYYGGLSDDTVDLLSRRRPPSSRRSGDSLAAAAAAAAAADGNSENNHHQPTVIRPHYAIEPAFLLLAGVSASVVQQLAVYPLTHLQLEHFNHLEDLDAKARRFRADPAGLHGPRDWRMWRAYYRAYQETWQQCASAAAAEGRSMAGWLYRGFWWNTIRQVPSTSAGLIIFELVRRKYGLGGDEVRITKDGYDILLA